MSLEEYRDTVLKISLAALFHDVGKFAQGFLKLPEGYQQNNADLYQPFNRERGYHTHLHALYTAAFIETHSQFLPTALSSRDWGEGEVEDSFVNLAAKHHRPDTHLQWIVAQADRLSSGIDRAEFEEGEKIGVKKVAQTRLLPILERLLREEKAYNSLQDFQWRYPLKPLSAISIFPVKAVQIPREEARKEYRGLYEAFCEDLKGLCNYQHVELWAQHFDSLYRIYTSHIPAARVGMVVHDVSLYDHSRSTAALAGALYLYHRLTDTMKEDAIKDDSLAKFLLVSGDFYGIQDFIFSRGGEERHHRAKLLRGRSFLVSLLVELAADVLCRRLGLSFLSVAISAAGKFHLIAHNVEEAKEEIKAVRNELNHWLYENFYGECALGISFTEAKAEDFCGERFKDLWDRHLRGLEEAKFNRLDLKEYGGSVAEVLGGQGYLDAFRNDLGSPLCPLCGKRPSHPDVVDDDFIRRDEGSCACKLCRDQALVGTKLVKEKRLAVLLGSEGELKEPLWGKYQLRFVKGCAGELADTGKVARFFEFNVREDGSCPTEVTFLPINGYVPVYTREDEYDDCLLAGERTEANKEGLIDSIREGRPKTFHHIAQKALRSFNEGGKPMCLGLPALGVLKADVDNLGAIFGCGLLQVREGKEDPSQFTLSRLATMSRQLNNFFALYLPFVLGNEGEGRFKEVYTVFAGGDDLFLIGPWNVVKNLALHIRDRFAEYVCENPRIHLSAGITLHKPYTPVDLLARESEEALEQAKGGGKNRVSMFGHVVPWDEFDELARVQEELEEWYRKGSLSRGALYRFNELCNMAAEERELLNKGAISWHELQCIKWRAFLRYYLVRALSDGSEENQYQDIALKVSEWLDKYRGRFVIALWPLLYETRKQRV